MLIRSRVLTSWSLQKSAKVWVVAEGSQPLPAIWTLELHAPDLAAVLFDQQEQALAVEQGVVPVPWLGGIALGV